MKKISAEDHKLLKVSLGYIVRPCLKNTHKKEIRVAIHICMEST
jgi:hypothetical protein